MYRKITLSLWSGRRLRAIEVVACDPSRLWFGLDVECFWLSDLLKLTILGKHLELHNDQDAIFVLVVARRNDLYLLTSCP